MSKIRKSSLLVPSPQTYVKSALAKVGSGYLITPYFWHDLISWFLQWVPQSILISYSNKMHKDIRKRALRKREKSKNQ